jgi:hypothetical protein
MALLRESIRRVSSADGGVVLDLCRGTMFRLNGLGSEVLDRLEKGESLEDIANRFSEESGVALDVVRADIRDFIDALERHGVLARADPRK